MAFYKKSLKKFQIIKEQYKIEGSMTLRRIYYVLLGKGLVKPSPKTGKKSSPYKDLSELLLKAREEGEIDWHLSAVEIWRRVRAFNPWPGCYTTWHGKQLRITEAVPLPEKSVPVVGQVVALSGAEAVLGIGTGDGTLGVLRVQLEGKRAMSAADFLRGQRQFMGAVLPLP